MECTSSAISSKEMARRMNIGLTLLYAMRKSGKLGPRPIRFGTSVKFLCSEVESWLAAGAPPQAKWEALRNAK
jgi:excisionase family DNA binding protein